MQKPLCGCVWRMGDVNALNAPGHVRPVTPPRLLTERVWGSDREAGPGHQVDEIELRVAQSVVQELVNKAGRGGEPLVGELLSDDEEPLFRDPGHHAEVIQVSHR